MVVSSRWHKGRFFHELSPEASTIRNSSSSTEQPSPILRLLELAQLNDKAVRVLKEGRINLALHLFDEALSHTRKFTPQDAQSVRCRTLTFSEVQSTFATPSASACSGPSSSCTRSSEHYLVPVECADESNIFSKAILLCASNLPATVHHLSDVLHFHLGLCRHIQGWESSSVDRRQALLSIAAKRYKNVSKQGSSVVKAAACCNLVACGNGALQDFLEAYQALEDPEDRAEFRACMTHTANAA